MNFDESNRTWSFWKIDSPLFIKIIYGYTSSIVCNINFLIIFLTPMNRVKTPQQNTLIKLPAGTKNCYIYRTARNAYTINCLRTIRSNFHSFFTMIWREKCMQEGTSDQLGEHHNRGNNGGKKSPPRISSFRRLNLSMVRG